MRRGFIILALLGILCGCMFLAAIVRESSGAAVDRALQDAGAGGQRVTAVCVGLNIGSCRTTQQSSSSSRPAGDDGDGIPTVAKLLVVAVVCPLLLLAALWLGGRSEEW